MHLAVSRGLVDRLLLRDIALARCHEPNLSIRRSRFGVALRPFVIVITDQQPPQPLFVAAIIGVGSLLRVGSDMTAPRTFVILLRNWALSLQRTMGPQLSPCIRVTFNECDQRLQSHALRFSVEHGSTEADMQPCALTERLDATLILTASSHNG